MTTAVIDLERIRFLHCGLGQYSLHLGRAILDEGRGDFHPVFILPRGGEAYFAPRPVRTIAPAPWRKDDFIGWLRPLAACWPRRSSVDVWHVTHQDSPYWPVDPRVPVVLTVHDLNFLREKPKHVIRRRLGRLRHKVDRAAIVTTGSEYAAREISEYIPLRGKEIRVIPHGVCLDRSAAGVRPAAVDAERPFLFAIGDISPKKNFHVLVDLLARLTGYSLVIAGSKSHDYAAAIERRASDCGLSPRVILPGRVSEAERNWLYEHCAAFLFPSLTEGFGLPLVEAMNYGRPVFSSRKTSLPEVGGPWTFYWDSFDAEDMTRIFQAGMRTYAADSGYSEKLRIWASRFCWRSAARRYLDVYRQVATAGVGRHQAA